MNNNGIEISGEMDFPDKIHLLNKLSAMGYLVSSIRRKSVSLTGFLESIGYSHRRIGRKNRMLFTRQMASLLEAGIPINTALHLISQQGASMALGPLAEQLRRDIEGGRSVSEALAGRRDVFSNSYISMIEAAELSGKLAEVFERLANLEEVENERREKVKSAVSYPVILMVASVLGITFLLVAVFPPFVKIFSTAKVTLPWTTRSLIGLSDFLRKNIIILVSTAAVTALLLKRYSLTDKGKYFFDMIKIRLPLFGDLFRKTAMSSFAHTYQAMNSSGIPVSKSLEVVSGAIGNSVIGKSVLAAREMIGDGSTITESFEKGAGFPPLVIHMLSIGEESGSMDEMLGKLREYYEREVSHKIDRLTATIEPMLIAVMGLVIAFMYLSLITPMMQMMKVAKGGGFG